MLGFSVLGSAPLSSSNTYLEQILEAYGQVTSAAIVSGIAEVVIGVVGYCGSYSTVAAYSDAQPLIIAVEGYCTSTGVLGAVGEVRTSSYGSITCTTTVNARMSNIVAVVNKRPDRYSMTLSFAAYSAEVSTTKYSIKVKD